tara:strand:+ start:2470 stop:3729 length:1260 start_codon:yes stop_codon:yes gene_type:complete
MLFQFLAMFGNAIGRGPFIARGATRHHTNLFVAVVGDTSRARKGTSLAEAERVMKVAKPKWASSCVDRGGLATGEGMIHRVRDEEVGADGKVVDEGVADKRLLVIEPEFGKVLKKGAGHRSIVSSTLRLAWDSGDLKNNTRGNPYRATNAHVSVCTHITKRELEGLLSGVEIHNGFANRLIWVAAKRRQKLPHPTTAPIENLGIRIAQTIRVASKVGEVTFADDARDLWAAAYEHVGDCYEDLPMLSRVEAQLLRLSLIYALLNRSREIEREHLLAALSCWRYAEQSALWIFGTKTKAELEDRILDYVVDHTERKASKTEIRRRVLNNRGSKEKVQAAYDTLRERGHIKIKTVGKPPGRCAKYVIATPAGLSSRSSRSSQLLALGPDWKRDLEEKEREVKEGGPSEEREGREEGVGLLG